MKKIRHIFIILCFCVVSACGSGATLPTQTHPNKDLMATIVAATLVSISSAATATSSPTASPSPILSRQVYEFRHRWFDPKSMFFSDDIPYPEELISIDESNIIPLGCSHRYDRFRFLGPLSKGQPTPTMEPELFKQYTYTDPVTKEKEALTDPLMKAFLVNAKIFAESTATRPGAYISYIFYCNIDNGDSIVFYGVGPCGAACLGNEHISFGKPDGSLVFVANNFSKMAYSVCDPLLLTTHHILYMKCSGEFSNTIKKIDLMDPVPSTVLECIVDIGYLSVTCKK